MPLLDTVTFQMAPSIEQKNTQTDVKFASLASELDKASKQRFLELIHSDGFAVLGLILCVVQTLVAPAGQTLFLFITVGGLRARYVAGSPGCGSAPG